MPASAAPPGPDDPRVASGDDPAAPGGPTEGEVLCRRLAVLAGHIHAAQAEMVELLGRLDACGAGTASASARSATGRRSSSASTHARPGPTWKAAKVLAEAPVTAAAARAGELGWAKVELVTRVVEPETDEKWCELAREMSVGQLRRVVSAFRRARGDDDHPPDDPSRRRGLWLFDEPDGLVRITGLLAPDDAAVLRAALNAQLERAWRAESVAAGPVERSSPDEPPRPGERDAAAGADCPVAARRADAFVDLLRSSLDHLDHPDLADDSTQVIVHVDLAFLAGEAGVGRCHTNHGDPLPREAARRAACDALVRPLLHDGDGRPLDLGRTTRTVNRAQRRALGRRDGNCCTFPGCTATIGLAAHHVVHWADGGSTDLDNLALLCRFHHRLHHESGYVARMVDGRPRFFRPDGRPIGPPAPPPPDPGRGLPALRAHHESAGVAVTQQTPGARSGGAPVWSPGLVLDARFW